LFYHKYYNSAVVLYTPTFFMYQMKSWTFGFKLALVAKPRRANRRS